MAEDKNEGHHRDHIVNPLEIPGWGADDALYWRHRREEEEGRRERRRGWLRFLGSTISTIITAILVAVISRWIDPILKWLSTR
jgi:hypothetical protein